MSIEQRNLTGGAAIVEAARANGMKTIFGVPGAQIYPLFDALHGTGSIGHQLGEIVENAIGAGGHGYSLQGLFNCLLR